MGRDRALGAEPLVAAADVQAAIDLTTETRQALASHGPPPLDVPDIRSLLEHCRAEGSTLDGPDLVLVLGALDAAPRLQAWGRAVAPVAPRVGADAAGVPRLTDLRDALRQALDDEGALTEGASPRLGRLRREIRDRRRRIVADLERRLHAGGERVFADRFVTLRHGRYVLPVRAEARGRVRGIVHDRSQSGQTLFVEPEDLVEANNDLVSAVRQEEQEAARILAALTAALRARLGEVARLVEAIGELDWRCARAHTAERMAATAPVVDPAGDIALRAARHPVLLAQTWVDPSRTVTPVDIEIARARPLLLVTGPNAGGKTIALKTLALAVLMAQVGCHVPAAEGSRLPVFERLYAVIGDEQSVAENLSTFSAFVKQVREVLAGADARSLVLLDELGAGTDPDEGAALAQAILEELDARGALVMATTHLEPLKAFASTHPRARNASVEFDAATLAPTFRLRYDVPGQSLALTIAGRLGLSPDLIARAQSHRDADRARLTELLARLDARARAEAERTLALERRESETAARLTAAREAEIDAERRAREVLERARAEAAGLVTEVRRALVAEWDRLKRAERSRPALEASRRRVQDIAARIDRLAPPSTPAAPDQTPLGPGDRVTAEHLGVRGELIAIAGATAAVKSGAVTVRVPLSALRRAESAAAVVAGSPARPGGWRREPSPAPAGTRAGPDLSSPDIVRAIPAELMLLGKTTDEARDLVEQYLDDAFMAGLPTVRLIHGKGTGALRKAVRALLADHPLVESFRDGEPSEGGAGATIAVLRMD